jgi:hypothetical protein
LCRCCDSNDSLWAKNGCTRYLESEEPHHGDDYSLYYALHGLSPKEKVFFHTIFAHTHNCGVVAFASFRGSFESSDTKKWWHVLMTSS